MAFSEREIAPSCNQNAGVAKKYNVLCTSYQYSTVTDHCVGHRPALHTSRKQSHKPEDTPHQHGLPHTLSQETHTAKHHPSQLECTIGGGTLWSHAAIARNGAERNVTAPIHTTAQHSMRAALWRVYNVLPMWTSRRTAAEGVNPMHDCVNTRIVLTQNSPLSFLLPLLYLLSPPSAPSPPAWQPLAGRAANKQPATASLTCDRRIDASGWRPEPCDRRPCSAPSSEVLPFFLGSAANSVGSVATAVGHDKRPRRASSCK